LANPEHVKVARQGHLSILNWMSEHPKEALDLSGADLSKVNLREALFVNTNLANANLSGANLRGANFQNAMLSNADLSNSDLSFAVAMDITANALKLTGAKLDSTLLVDCDFHDSDLSETTMRFSNIHSSNFCNCTFLKTKIAISNMGSCNLLNANFVSSDLFQTDFSGSKIGRTNFSESELSHVIFKYIDFSETNFSKSNLEGTVFLSCDIGNSVFSGSSMRSLTFGNCKLDKIVGSETVEHRGPSNIDFNTLLKSFSSGGNSFSAELEIFLLRSGLPKNFLVVMTEIIKSPTYYKTFISYGEPDHEFAKKIYEDLWRVGCQCWFYDMDATPGEDTWHEIDQKLRDAEKVIVICSSESLVRPGVLKELSKLIDDYQDKLIPISRDDLWKAEGFIIKYGNEDLKPFLKRKNYADFAIDENYNKSLCKLLNGLKRKNQDY
jgi:uncharacterized protein YjbI with pentapeptide repeats